MKEVHVNIVGMRCENDEKHTGLSNWFVEAS
jgi:hypothetical protein